MTDGFRTTCEIVCLIVNVGILWALNAHLTVQRARVAALQNDNAMLGHEVYRLTCRLLAGERGVGTPKRD